MNNIRKFEKNTLGSDYVVGDIHGCFYKLDDALYEIGFDRKKDRLFSVGDLVDRGLDSIRSVSFLEKPWFHAVRGNHEQMAIEYFNGRWPKHNYIINGGTWFTVLSKETQQQYVEAFDQLPYLIEVETDVGLIGIVHAECPVDDWEQLKLLISNENIYNNESYTASCIWSRTKVTNVDCSIVKNIHEIYVGHTPMKMVIKMGNTNYIDTGAVFDNELTIVKIQ